MLLNLRSTYIKNTPTEKMAICFVYINYTLFSSHLWYIVRFQRSCTVLYSNMELITKRTREHNCTSNNHFPFSTPQQTPQRVHPQIIETALFNSFFSSHVSALTTSTNIYQHPSTLRSVIIIKYHKETTWILLLCPNWIVPKLSTPPFTPGTHSLRMSQILDL